MQLLFRRRIHRSLLHSEGHILQHRLWASFGTLILLTLSQSSPTLAQRQYRFEAGAAGTLQGFGEVTDLGSAAGGTLRLGYWLPWYRLSVEGEGTVAQPKAKSTDETVSVRSLSGSLLVNLPIGLASSAYLKGGYAGVTYGGDCPNVAPSTTCGSTGALLGGVGARFAVSPTLMIRTEGVLTRSQTTPSFSNYALSAGVTLMLGSRPLADTDRDGVNDRTDRCPDTPIGALANRQGCPSDADTDGVVDGLDRCPSTLRGASVNAIGCSADSDKDGVEDGLDRCASTPAGAAIDAFGCPQDADGDKVLDGMDRCPGTPEGATVDAVGCPEDRDNDGVFEGLDKCPDTPPGIRVNAAGCPSDLDSDRDGVPDGVDECANTSIAVKVDAKGCPTGEPRLPGAPQPPAPAPGGPILAKWPWIVPGNAFAPRSARLTSESFANLDSLVRILTADTTLWIEIKGHADDSKATSDNQRLSRLRAEAVRNYLIDKGIAFQRLVARGVGDTAPVTADTTATGRTANRRVEITPLQSGP